MGGMETPDLDTSWEAWKADPTPERLGSVVSGLDGTVHHTLRSIGAPNDPYLRSKARVLAADAVRTYDPTYGASLRTWTSHQLMPLRRLKRERSTAIKVPERAQNDAYALELATRKYVDEHNREPDMQELSDVSGYPVRRIRRVRETIRPVVAEGVFDGITMGSETDYREEALDYIYNDASALERKIIEMRTGYGGNAPMAPGDVARKLKLTPVQLSRHSARLGMQVLEIEKALGS